MEGKLLVVGETWFIGFYMAKEGINICLEVYSLSNKPYKKLIYKSSYIIDI